MLKILLADPRPNSRNFFNVVANILFKISFICLWDAALHNNYDTIKIHNALIWVLQDLSNNPRTMTLFLAIAFIRTCAILPEDSYRLQGY